MLSRAHQASECDRINGWPNPGSLCDRLSRLPLQYSSSEVHAGLSLAMAGSDAGDSLQRLKVVVS